MKTKWVQVIAGVVFLLFGNVKAFSEVTVGSNSVNALSSDTPIFLMSQANPRDRAGRYFRTSVWMQFGLVVAHPLDPDWSYSVDREGDVPKVVLTSPLNYYPPTVMDVMKVKSVKVKSRRSKESKVLQDMAVAGIHDICGKSKLSEKQVRKGMNYIEFPYTVGFEYFCEIEDGPKKYDMHLLVGVLEDDSPVTYKVVTERGHIGAIQHMTYKIWNQISDAQAGLDRNNMRLP